MGMDLHGAEKYMRLNWSNWEALLALAYLFGWEGPGTLPPDLRDQHGQPIYPADTFKDWSGTYFSNSYQRVTAEDAHNLAEALERALRSGGVLDREALGRRQFLTEVSKNPVVDPSVWCGERRELAQEFIAFCRAGGFVIG
jgi:hypothetical protein